MCTSRLVVLSVCTLSACAPSASLRDWDDSTASRQSECDGPAGPTTVLNPVQNMLVPSLPGSTLIGDNPVLDGTSMALGGLTAVQFYELGANDLYEPTSYFTGPSGAAFGRSLSMDNGLALIGEDNYQLPGQAFLSGRVSAYRKAEDGTWSLDPVTPYLNLEDVGLVFDSHLGFGHVVEQEGHTIVLGAMRADSAGNTSKGIFTFTEQGGWQIDTILPNVGNGPAAIWGDYIATADRLSGTIRVFKRTDETWSNVPVATIARPAGASFEYAKCSDCLSFDEDRLIMGDIRANGGLGGAFVLRRQTGGETFTVEQLLTPPGGTIDGNGFSLTARSGRAYIGSANGNRLTVYEYNGSSYQQVTVLTGAEDYGRGVSVDGNRLLVAQAGGFSAAATHPRAILYAGEDGVLGFCEDPTGDLSCVAGEPFDWDGDGEDDGCRGATDIIDPTVVVPPGTQMGEGVQLLAGVTLGTGNVLGDGVTLGERTVLGDDNDLGVGTIVGRRAQLGSGNVLQDDTVFGRGAIIGDDNILGGTFGYGSEVGSNLNLPDVMVGSLVTVGAVDGAPGQVDCPGPLVIARGSTVAPTAADTFTCTGSVVIGPNVLVESADVGQNIRLRKDVILESLVTLGDDVRVGREVTVEGGVALSDDTTVGSLSRLCDTASPFSGLIERAFADPTCP